MQVWCPSDHLYCQKLRLPRRHFRHGENGSRLRFLEISRKIPRYRAKNAVLGKKYRPRNLPAKPRGFPGHNTIISIRYVNRVRVFFINPKGASELTRGVGDSSESGIGPRTIPGTNPSTSPYSQKGLHLNFSRWVLRSRPTLKGHLLPGWEAPGDITVGLVCVLVCVLVIGSLVTLVSHSQPLWRGATQGGVAPVFPFRANP